MKHGILITALSISIIFVVVLCIAVGTQAPEIAVRMGQGGFRDNSAPDGKLGGGQLFLDLKLNYLPLVFSFGEEYYPKGPEPTHACEIFSLIMCNLFFTKALSRIWPVNFYLGGGVGRLKIPQGNKAAAVQVIARVDIKCFWKIYGYTEGKYIYSNKDLIDFNEAALLIGICFKFEF